MTIEYAITKAIEAGYDFERLCSQIHETYQAEARRQGDVRHEDAYEELAENVKEFDRVMARKLVFLDPLFWQSLGKALGWKYPESIDREGDLNGEYMKRWHGFIDHLAKGGSAESFFETLT